MCCVNSGEYVIFDHTENFKLCHNQSPHTITYPNIHCSILTWQRGQEELNVYQYLPPEKLDFECEKKYVQHYVPKRLYKIPLHGIR